MLDQKDRLRVAVIGSNNSKKYSGGRYHALIIAYALARAGAEVTIVTNTKPVFFADLEPLSPGGVRYLIAPSFNPEVAKGAFDYAVIVPTGIFQPEFYENALDFARRAGARPALINFESANWFNSLAPVRRDVRLWDYWRRCVAQGGLVISSARESDTWARDFYDSWPGSALRFEVCSPPINSVSADKVLHSPKDGSVLAFVRAADVHKGGGDLLSLPPSLLSGRKLCIVAGGGIEPDFAAALKRHFSPDTGVRLSLESAVSDDAKFALIRAAQALIFPSRFEGFGYPPVEAAYVGTECVAYDLPVIRETAGKYAHLAPMFDTAALADRLSDALAMPERTETLHGSVHDLVNIDSVGVRMQEILLRNFDAVAPMSARSDRTIWGPYPGNTPDPEIQDSSPLPARTLCFAKTPADDLVLSIQVCTRKPLTRIACGTTAPPMTEVLLETRGTLKGWTLTRISGLLPLEAEGAELRLQLVEEDGASEWISVTLNTAGSLPESRPHFGLQEISKAEDGSWLLRFDDSVASAVAISRDGGHSISADRDRGHLLTIPFGGDPSRGMTVYAFKDDGLISVQSGFPPMSTVRRQAQVLAESLFRSTKLPVVGRNDDHWRSGVSRNVAEGDDMAVLCARQPGSIEIGAGDILRTQTGRLCRVTSVSTPDDTTLQLQLDRPLSPTTEGAPHVLTRIGPAKATEASIAEPNWARGIWEGNGPFSRRCVILSAEQLAIVSDHPHGIGLLTPDRTYIGISAHYPREDGILAVLEMTLPESVTSALELEVIPNAAARGVTLANVPADGLRNGIFTQTGGSPRMLVPAWAHLSVGDTLVFPKSGRRRVTSIEVMDADAALSQAFGQGVAVVHLDMRIDPDGDAAGPRFAGLSEILDSNSESFLHPSPVRSRHASTLARLLDRYASTDRPSPPVTPDASRPRVLFATLVPPYPKDQGNRIVTHNFLNHLVNQGFDVDLLLVGEVSPTELAREFGDRVRLFSWPYPEWNQAPQATLQRTMLSMLQKARREGLRILKGDALHRDLSSYDPFFIVPDPLVRLGRALYASTQYHSIVCNYTHMIRLPLELEAIRPLPPVTVVTHDALSRLPFHYGDVDFDTSHRYCPPEVERDTLNAIEGATILAISESELAYFKDIGVTNPIILCEYDGHTDGRRYQLPSDAFARKTLIFNASGNPMNVAAFRWFEKNCWPAIQQQIPDVRFVVCGNICRALDMVQPGITLKGSMPREGMMIELSRASVAINPTLAGTGLKIKTVEAVCCGLPSVCMPAAVEGLENVVDGIGILAEDAKGFTQGCIVLLTDEKRWEAQRAAALRLARERFSETAIYRDVDARMGWSIGREARFEVPRVPYLSDMPQDAISLADHLPAAQAHRLRNTSALIEGGAPLELLWPLLEPLLDVAADPAHEFHDALALAGIEAASGTSAIVDYTLRRLSHDPGNTRSWALLGLAAQGVQNSSFAKQVEMMAFARAPSAFSPWHQWKSASRAELNATNARVVALPIWDIPLGVSLPPPHFAGFEQLGLNWAQMEMWGAWTIERYATITLRMPAKNSAATLTLDMRSVEAGNQENQTVRLYANSQYLGEHKVSRSDDSTILSNLPVKSDDKGELYLEFFCGDVNMVRNADGEVIDTRTLGIALRALRVDLAEKPKDT